MSMTPTVKQLLIINIMVFIASMVIDANAFGEGRLSTLFSLHFPLDHDFGIWQLITHMFMHANVLHIAFNMFALFSFGSMLEYIWGGNKFMFFYISCGLGAAALQLGIGYIEYTQAVDAAIQAGVDPNLIDKIVRFAGSNAQQVDYANSLLPNYPQLTSQGVNAIQSIIGMTNSAMLGASGAVYGLLVAFAFTYPSAELAMFFIPIPIKAKYFVPGILLLDLILGLMGSSLFGANTSPGGVAHFAHIGGAIVGFIMMYIWNRRSFNDRRWD